MRKRFELESVRGNFGYGDRTRMVFSAFDESNQCFVKMVCEPRAIKTINPKATNKAGTLKVIEGEIIEIVRYV